MPLPIRSRSGVCRRGPGASSASESRGAKNVSHSRRYHEYLPQCRHRWLNCTGCFIALRFKFDYDLYWALWLLFLVDVLFDCIRSGHRVKADWPSKWTGRGFALASLYINIIKWIYRPPTGTDYWSATGFTLLVSAVFKIKPKFCILSLFVLICWQYFIFCRCYAGHSTLRDGGNKSGGVKW